MRPCSIIVALCALFFFSGNFVSAEEHSTRFVTLLSPTMVRGYIDTSGYNYWRRHVCRPVRPVRALHLYKWGPNGTFRGSGYIVHCRHGGVYLPEKSVVSLSPTPNRSSRFSPEATPRINHQVIVILIDDIPIEQPLPPTHPPPDPFSPPRNGGGGGGGGGFGVVDTFPQLRPPTPLMPTNRPPVIVSPPPIFGGSYSGSISQRYQVSSEQRLPRTVPPDLLPPELRAAVGEFMQREEYRDVPHDTNLDARWLLRMDRRPNSQPPDRFVRGIR
jgi:hypothetical protein